MINSSAASFSAESRAWSDVARLCRRICVLHERGRSDEAERLQAGELATLLAELRKSSDTDDGMTARLDGIFAVERERVANAAVLAELLVPLLPEHGRPNSASHPAASIASDAVRLADAPRPMKSPPRARPAKVDIADFIDEMIAQESAPVRAEASPRSA